MFVTLTQRFPDYAWNHPGDDAPTNVNPGLVVAVQVDTSHDAPEDTAILTLISGHNLYVRESRAQVMELFTSALQQRRP